MYVINKVKPIDTFTMRGIVNRPIAVSRCQTYAGFIHYVESQGGTMITAEYDKAENGGDAASLENGEIELYSMELVA